MIFRHVILQELQFMLKIFNFFFTSVFIVEALVKMISLGVLRYLLDRSSFSNRFDYLEVTSIERPTFSYT